MWDAAVTGIHNVVINALCDYSGNDTIAWGEYRVMLMLMEFLNV